MTTRSLLFEYAIIWHPTEKEEKEGETAKILVDLKRVLAKDATIVHAIAARDIPSEYIDKINQIQILIRR